MSRNNRQPLEAKALSKKLCSDVIPIILETLPAKALLRFQCVSKTWCSLISDSRFIRNHHERTDASQKLVFRERLEKTFLTMFSEDGQKPRIESSHFPWRRDLQVLCFCDGLVMLRNRVTRGINHVYFLWNPSVRMYTTFSYPRHFNQNRFKLGDGLCYDSSTYDYKVIVVFDGHYFIYSVGNNSWGESKVFPYSQRFLRGSVFVNGALHWLAPERTSEPTSYSFYANYQIVSFDPKDESFCMLPRPDSVEEGCWFELMTVCGNLGLYCYFRGSKTLQIWLRKGEDYKNASCWQSLIVISVIQVQQGFGDARPVCFLSRNEIVLHIGNHDLVLYDVMEEAFLEIDGSPSVQCFTSVGSYRDSLLLPGDSGNKTGRWLPTKKCKRTAGRI